MSSTIVWFRRDLRISDHPALAWAASRPGPVIPVFIWAPEEEAPWQPGAASRWWLHHSLTALQRQLAERGSGLVVREGASLDTLLDLVRETGATAVCWNERYEPAGRRMDEDVARALRAEGVAVSIHNGALLHNPDQIRTGGDAPYRVFTPFWKKLQLVPELGAPLPEANLSSARVPAEWPASVPIDRLRLLPTLSWDAGFPAVWEPGEAGARRALTRYLDGPAGAYDTDRNRPDRPGTSRLSPHLCFGEISPQTVWCAVRERMPAGEKPAQVFLSEIAWREFSYHLMFHFPQTTDQPLNPRFAAFPWHEDASALRRWQRGQTGYPIVDAGMREMWATGWMHNRVRMVVASFLTKDLMIPWQAGARWFWDTLVDADLANNTQGWQWSAGCGADAQPFFRIFNPVSQGERFDPDGTYVRRWVPELARLPAAHVHAPWTAPLFASGAGYPEPMVDHGHARDAALEAFAQLPPA